ncbi:hypothetical protein VNO77_39505 [Canavalia gladiata]|uniref:O-methyltransferase n=1 Tax=Canavalia gladiata TaxID=3824 RepID=A0AAN9KAK3_CANGL
MGEIQKAELEKKKEEAETEAEVEIWKLVFGFVEVAAVKCAIELGIADAIESHGSPMTLSEISSILKCDPSLLNRIMRFLMHRKMFKSVPTSHGNLAYAQTPLSRRLLRNDERSVAAAILWHYSPPILAPWQALSARVLANGNPPFENIHGINFDLPHVIAVAPKCDRVEHVAGDMFQSVPKADAIFLKWILHDWGDEECIQILKKCREGIPKENGKVIILDHVMEDGGFKDVGLIMDMVMMAHTNSGKERTLKEWEYVIKTAGFSSYNVKSIHAVQSVIVAFY